MNNTMISNKIGTYVHLRALGSKAYLKVIRLKSHLRVTGYKLLVALMLTLYLMIPISTHFIIHKFSLTAL
jgi:uncharacterized paraquat-inducible protein A